MKLIRSYKTSVFYLLCFILLNSCSKEFETETFENSSLVSVKLQGTPTSILNKVNIEVIDIQFRILEDDNDPNAWVSMNTINTGIHDLADITNDQVVTLVDFEEMPTRFVYSIKVVFGSENSVIKNGIEYRLNIAPEYQNESVNIVDKQLIANQLYDFLIEFDTDGSIVFSPDGEASFNPKMNTLLRRFELF